MRRTAMIAIAVPVIVAAAWGVWRWLQPKDVSASVRCGEVEMIQTNLGILNIAQLSLGQYIFVDTAQGVAFHGGFIDPGQAVQTQPVASLSTAYDANLSVSLSAEVPTAVKAEAEQAISRSTRLIAKGVRRETIENVPRAVEADARASDDLHRALQREGIVPFVVHAVILADSLAVGSSQGVEASSDTRLAVQKYRVAVNYQCSQALEVFGQEVPIFFKVTPLTYSEPQGFFVDTKVDVDFTKVRMAQTAR